MYRVATLDHPSPFPLVSRIFVEIGKNDESDFFYGVYCSKYVLQYPPEAAASALSLRRVTSC